MNIPVPVITAEQAIERGITIDQLKNCLDWQKQTMAKVKSDEIRDRLESNAKGLKTTIAKLTKKQKEKVDA